MCIDIQCYKNLGCAIAIQAAKDYAAVDATPQKRAHIIRQLRSPYMEFVTGGIAPMLADALKRDHKAVVTRIYHMEEDEQCDTQ